MPSGKPASLVWWGGCDVEVNSGGARVLLNPYKNYYRSADYIIASNNDLTSANREMIGMAASVSAGLKAIIVQRQENQDFWNSAPMSFNPADVSITERIRKLVKVLPPGGTYKDVNIAVTAVSVKTGESTLIIDDRKARLRYVYAVYTDGNPAPPIMKALEMAGSPVDYLIIDLTRVAQRDLREMLKTFRPRYLLPVGYHYEVTGIDDEKTPDVSTSLPVVYGSRPAETAEAVPYRVYYPVAKARDMNVRYLPRFVGPLRKFIQESDLPTKITAPKPGQEIDLHNPPELGELPPADMQPTRIPADPSRPEPYDPLTVQPCPANPQGIGRQRK
ncbi:MAG: hypothetical protein GX410_09930 [Elusimicrobia bacterium]|nr:hypothetical protein [Elusimicrobiota bacterium]